MANGANISCTMEKAYECKHSVRYNAADDLTKKMLTSIYIGRIAYDVLKQPEYIIVEINLPGHDE